MVREWVGRARSRAQAAGEGLLALWIAAVMFVYWSWYGAAGRHGALEGVTRPIADALQAFFTAGYQK